MGFLRTEDSEMSHGVCRPTSSPHGVSVAWLTWAMAFPSISPRVDPLRPEMTRGIAKSENEGKVGLITVKTHRVSAGVEGWAVSCIAEV